MQSIAETCVRFDAAHLSINLVLEIAVPMFPTLMCVCVCVCHSYQYIIKISTVCFVCVCACNGCGMFGGVFL